MESLTSSTVCLQPNIQPCLPGIPHVTGYNSARSLRSHLNALSKLFHCFLRGQILPIFNFLSEPQRHVRCLLHKHFIIGFSTLHFRAWIIFFLNSMCSVTNILLFELLKYGLHPNPCLNNAKFMKIGMVTFYLSLYSQNIVPGM